MTKIPNPDAMRQSGSKAAAFLATFEAKTGLRPHADARAAVELPELAPAPPTSGAGSSPACEPGQPAIAAVHKRNTRVIRPALTLRERNARAAARKRARLDQRARIEAARDERVYARFKERLEKAGACSHDAPPPQIPGWIWRMAWTVVGDATGGAGRSYLRRLQNVNASAVGGILRAAFGEEATIDQPRDSSWADLHTRRIVAAGLGLVHLARKHRKRGPWGAQVRGVPAGAFMAMLHDPFDQRPARPVREMRRDPDRVRPLGRGMDERRPGTPHYNTVFSNPNARRGEYGYMGRLRRAGLFKSFQLPRDEAGPDEVGPTGHPYARYDVVTDSSERTTTPEQSAVVEALSAVAVEALRSWVAPAARAAPS